MNKNKALGKGLSDLMEDIDKENNIKVNLELLKTSPYQPRRNFSESDLKDLSNSIMKNGLMLPIIVREVDGNYEIVAGERRWRASKMAGLNEVPIIIKDLSDEQALEIALIENIQRQDLTSIEKAKGFQVLIDKYNHSQEQISKNIGKTRTYISNLLRLLKLPESVQNLVNESQISMGHARALVEYENAEELARKIVREGLSVRQTEEAVRRAKTTNSSKGEVNHQKKDDDILTIEKSISESLGLPVKIENTKNGGKIIISFGNLTQLDMILKKLDT